MKRFRQLILTILLLLFFNNSHAEIIDRVIAVVNDDIITLSEVNTEGRAVFTRIMRRASPEERDQLLQKARQNIIASLIEQKLIEQQARKRGVTVGDQEAQRALQRILGENQLSMEQFQQELDANGTTLEQHMTKLKRQLLASKMIAMDVRSKIIIPEHEISQYYNEHYTARIKDGEYYILQLGCNIQAGSANLTQAKQEALRRIQNVHALAMAGNDFADLAREHSDLPSAADGGDIGIFQKDEMARYMLDAVANLKPGEISDIVETSNGYQFYKLLANQKGDIVHTASYQSVKGEIHDILYQQKVKSAYDEWIQRLREQSFINITH